MKAPDSNLSVYVGNKTEGVWIRVEGRANLNCSVDFKTLVLSLWAKGYDCFHLDLTKCLLMDSTFLGVLSGLGLKMVGDPPRPENHTSIQLLNPNQRIYDLLENLGVTHLFDLQKLDGEVQGPYEHQTPSTPNAKEIARTSLEAHVFLGCLNSANACKFKDVVEYLANDLKKLDEQQENSGKA